MRTSCESARMAAESALRDDSASLLLMEAATRSELCAEALLACARTMNGRTFRPMSDPASGFLAAFEDRSGVWFDARGVGSHRGTDALSEALARCDPQHGDMSEHGYRGQFPNDAGLRPSDGAAGFPDS